MLNITSKSVQTVAKSSTTRAKREYVKAFAHPLQAALSGLTSLTSGTETLIGPELDWACKQGIFHPQNQFGKVDHTTFVIDRESGVTWVPNTEYRPDYLFSQLPLTAPGENPQGIVVAAEDLGHDFIDINHTDKGERDAVRKEFRSKVMSPLNMKARSANAECVAESVRFSTTEEGFIVIYKSAARKTKA